MKTKANDSGADIRLADFFEQVYRPEKLASRSKKLIKQYRIVIRAFLKRYGEDVRCCTITPEMVDAFERWRIEQGSEAYAFRFRSTVVAILIAYHKKHGTAARFYHRHGRLGEGPGCKAKTYSLEPGELWHLYKTSYRVRELPKGSKKTDLQYRVQLTHWAKFLGHEPLVTDLTEEKVAAFLCHHAENRAARTANKAYYCLVALWRHAAKRHLVDEWPTLKPFDEPRRIPQAWTLEELGRLLAACHRQRGQIGEVAAGVWWYALHFVCFHTGERIEAVLSIRMENVNWERGEIFIPAEARKGKRRDMLYRLRADTMEALAAIKEPARELLFPPLGSVFYYRYTRLLKDAGLPSDRRCKPQKLRRTFASYVEAAGGNATQALEHSSRALTLRSYLDPRICGGQNPAELLPEVPKRPGRGVDAGPGAVGDHG